MTSLTEADFRAAKVLPVIEIDDAAHAADLAAALAAGGLTILELTLRSAAALPALRAMKKARPDLIVGMGTVLTPDQADAAVEAGADFLVTPGATPRLLSALARLSIPSLPGVATLGEAMLAMEHGFTFVKLFPAEAIGGVRLLKAFAGPLPSMRFCPTGGIAVEKIGDYFALPNVVCVGGSWIAPREAVARGDFALITANAARAATMPRE